MSEGNLNRVPEAKPGEQPKPKGPPWRGHVVSHQNHLGVFIDELVIDTGEYDPAINGSRFKGHGMMGLNIPGRGRQEVPYIFEIPAETIEEAMQQDVLQKASEAGAAKKVEALNAAAREQAAKRAGILRPGDPGFTGPPPARVTS